MNGPEGDDDKRLFREAVRGTRPLEAERRAPPRRKKPPARARFTRADRQAVLRESLEIDVQGDASDSGDALSFRRAGVQDAVLRKLRRGQYRTEADLDLHGLTQDDAKLELRAFLAECIERRLRCVRIVHGKGLRSGHRGPVLKTAVNGWLRRFAAVLAFTSARQVDGGTGAIYVLLSASS